MPADELQFLNARRSVPAKQLGAPGPDGATLMRVLGGAGEERERVEVAAAAVDPCV